MLSPRTCTCDSDLLAPFALAPNNTYQLPPVSFCSPPGTNVSAKDTGTGQERNIIIKLLGGLSEDDIEKMVRDAEANSEADAKRRLTIEVKNEIDSLIYSTEKSLTDNGDKLDAETKTEVEKAVAEAKEVKDGEDSDAITAKEALSQASMKIGQAVYGSGDQQAADGEPKDDNTVDADFKEKKEEEEKKDEKEEEEKKDEEKK